MKKTRYSHAGQNPVTDHIDLWTSALLNKSTAGRGSNGKQQAYGIKKLRELVLELAVRGKLVPHDPNDEPSSILLEKLTAEKNKLIKDKLIRTTKTPVLPTEPPDGELPDSWVWTNLYEIGEIGPRNEAEEGIEASFVPMQLISENYGVQVEHEVKQWKEMKSGFTHFKEEDVVLAKITPCFQNGKSAVMRGLTNGFGAGTTELHVYRAINSSIDPEYVLIYLKSPGFILEGIPKMTGTAGQKRITRDYFAGNHFPLPPIAEQHRIVAKVDELMTLCDQLEQQQTDSIAAHQTLVETLLDTLTNVDSAEELSQAWTRIADHFDTLFTTEHSIDQLKQTLLQLAVMGKLVPQDPNDESANVLLEKIVEEKARLVKEGKIKKQKSLPDIGEDEKVYELPHGWEWSRWDEIALKIGDIDHKMPGQVKEGFPYVSPRDFLPNNIIDLEGAKKISREDFLRLAAKIQPTKGDIIYPRYGTIGENRLVDTEQDFLASYSCCVIKTVHGFIDPKYQFIFSISNLIKVQAKKAENKTTQANVGIKSIQNYVVPLPPLAEQHRIVAKVDELMALCDILKARINEAQTTQIHLADAIVEQAVSATGSR